MHKCVGFEYTRNETLLALEISAIIARSNDLLMIYL